MIPSQFLVAIIVIVLLGLGFFLFKIAGRLKNKVLIYIFMTLGVIIVGLGALPILAYGLYIFL